MADKQLVPDTLLLEERAGFVLNVIIGLADDEWNGVPFFTGILKENPAKLLHGDWDYGSSHGRLIDGLLLARHMSGIMDGQEVEEQYKKNQLSYLRENGLSYRQFNPHYPKDEPYANLIDQRAVILSLTNWYMNSEDPQVKEAADKHVAALKRIAIKERNLWYYPASEYHDDGWPSENGTKLRLAPDPASFMGRMIMPLLKYHEVTGNRDAFEICQFFAQMIIEKSGVYNEDGSFNDALAYRSGHFHTRLGTLDALARFAIFTGDASITHFVKKSYDWALTQCTRFGWTPGDMKEQAYEHETCSLVDLIACGIALAQSGYTEYWGIVERFLRNHLVESQLLDLDWVEESDDKSNDVPGYVTYYKVAERSRGAFAGYSAPNDFICEVNHGRGHTADLQTCCIGSGTRGLFMGWNNTITEKNGTYSVNFLLSRGSKWLDVNSYLPHEGKVELIIHKDLPHLQIRIPEWAGYANVQATCELNGETTTIGGNDPSVWVKDCFFQLGEAKAGTKITVTFPVAESVTTETAMGQEFTVNWRGDDVYRITPAGKYHPLYNSRKIYDQVPMREYDYQRPENELRW